MLKESVHIKHTKKCQTKWTCENEQVSNKVGMWKWASVKQSGHVKMNKFQTKRACENEKVSNKVGMWKWTSFKQSGHVKMKNYLTTWACENEEVSDKVGMWKWKSANKVGMWKWKTRWHLTLSCPNKFSWKDEKKWMPTEPDEEELLSLVKQSIKMSTTKLLYVWWH